MKNKIKRENNRKKLIGNTEQLTGATWQIAHQFINKQTIEIEIEIQ